MLFKRTLSKKKADWPVSKLIPSQNDLSLEGGRIRLFFAVERPAKYGAPLHLATGKGRKIGQGIGGVHLFFIFFCSISRPIGSLPTGLCQGASDHNTVRTAVDFLEIMS